MAETIRTPEQSTFVAVLTAAGRSAIATIGLRGLGSEEMVRRHFRPSNRARWSTAFPTDRIIFGKWARGAAESGDEAAEELIVCRRSQDNLPLFEIHCHGGEVAPRAIVDGLVADGAREVSWHDWLAQLATSQIDLEVDIALADAPTWRTASILLDQRAGVLSETIKEIVAQIANTPEGAHDRLKALIETARWGLHLTQPWHVAIIGPPNAGKSSLINAILGYERAIVHNEPGTTRDVLTGKTAIDGWPMTFADSAGMRKTSDTIESQGVDFADKLAESSDCRVLVFDASQPWCDACEALVKKYRVSDCLVIQNKRDLIGGSPDDRPADVWTSAKTGEGVPELLQTILATLVPTPPAPGHAVVFTKRQRNLLVQATACLASSEGAEARRLLAMLDQLAP